MSQACTVTELLAALGAIEPLILLDVRRAPAFEQADAVIAGATWRDPEAVEAWAGELDPVWPVVVYCVHGHEVSQGTADKLVALGFRARHLEGGFERWQAAGAPLSSKPGDRHEMDYA